MASKDEIIIGIDLGTRNTCVAMRQRKGGEIEFEYVENRLGEKTMPSMVAFANGEVLIGKDAKSQLAINPENTVYSVKRLIGRKASDPEVKRLFKNATFKIEGDDNDNPRIIIQDGGKTQYFYSEQISAIVLGEVKEIIKSKVGRLPDHCIITVPAYFNELQRAATKHAAEIAELPLVTIINEPTAAAIAYQHFYNFDEGIFLVYDFGGGTLDVSIVEINNNKFIVRAVSGEDFGGDDIDNVIVNEMVKRFMEKNPGKDPHKNPRSMGLLKAKAEEAKIQLSSSFEARIVIPYFVDDLTLDEKLTRSAFIFLCDDIFEKLTDCIERAMEDAGISKDKFTHILLVGGSSYIPYVRTTVSEYFGNDIPPLNAVPPDTAIAVGAAIFCDKMVKETKLETNESVSEPPHPPSSTPQEEDNDPNDGCIEIVDVQSCSIGILSHHRDDEDDKKDEEEDKKDDFKKFIYRNKPLPQENAFYFRTTKDYQKYAHIDILIGEDDKVDWEKRTHIKIDRFTLTNLPLKPKGQVMIKVTMRVDETGILDIDAQCTEDEHIYKKCQIDTNKVFTNDKLTEAIRIQQEIFDYNAKRNEYRDLLDKFQKAIARFRAKYGKSETKSWEQALENFTDNVPTNIGEIIQAINHLETAIQDINDKIKKDE